MPKVYCKQFKLGWPDLSWGYKMFINDVYVCTFRPRLAINKVHQHLIETVYDNLSKEDKMQFACKCPKFITEGYEVIDLGHRRGFASLLDIFNYFWRQHKDE